MTDKKVKVLVGMSGGVDSSVAAALLVEQGYEVIGAFMKNWSGACGWREDRRDAIRVAAKLGIPFVTLDFEKDYREKVIKEMFSEYEAGRTPNPDILCNKFIKFDLFVKVAEKMGCRFVATGHYAQQAEANSQKQEILNIPKDKNKDQTYFLWAMPPSAVPKTIFPLGNLLKSEVRKKARQFGLTTAEKEESMGICFVGEINVKEFLLERIKKNPGKIITTDGREVGQHDGLSFYTIGQRHGLEVGGGEPFYVIKKDQEKNQLIVGSNFNPELFKKKLIATKLNWFERPDQLIKCQARTRHRQELQDCQITVADDRVEVYFNEPQRAITPGQSIVFYREGKMIGGGIIK